MIAVVVAAGGIGAGLRFLAGSAIQSRLGTELPWGTGLVNVVGAFCLGAVVGSGIGGTAADAATGLLAGFTTYSTWMIESVNLWLDGSGGARRALLDVFVVAAGGVGAAALGYVVGGL